MRRILRDISVIVIVILSAMLIVISVISASIFITGSLLYLCFPWPLLRQTNKNSQLNYFDHPALVTWYSFAVLWHQTRCLPWRLICAVIIVKKKVIIVYCMHVYIDNRLGKEFYWNVNPRVTHVASTCCGFLILLLIKCHSGSSTLGWSRRIVPGAD